MNSNLKKGIYIYILETTINNLYKIGVTEQKNGNRDFKRLFAYANGYRGCQIKRCIYFQKTTSNNIIDFDSLNKNFLNNLNHDIFMHTDKDHEFYLSQNINKSIEHYKKHFSSHLEKECVQRSFISEINIKIFDDWKFKYDDLSESDSSSIDNNSNSTELENNFPENFNLKWTYFIDFVNSDNEKVLELFSNNVCKGVSEIWVNSHSNISFTISSSDYVFTKQNIFNISIGKSGRPEGGHNNYMKKMWDLINKTYENKTE